MASLKVMLVCVVLIALFVDAYAASVEVPDGTVVNTHRHRRRVRKQTGDNVGLLGNIINGVQGLANGVIDTGKGLFGNSGLLGGIFNGAGDLVQGIVNGTASVLSNANKEVGNFARQAKDTGKSIFNKK